MSVTGVNESSQHRAGLKDDGEDYSFQRIWQSL
ncbi:UNVERIFIED_ORG: hypothetical protein J2W64_004611 [Rahnella aquatilis]|nr:hypothetical protein [Rahnella aquatilis]